MVYFAHDISKGLMYVQKDDLHNLYYVESDTGSSQK